MDERSPVSQPRGAYAGRNALEAGPAVSRGDGPDQATVQYDCSHGHWGPGRLDRGRQRAHLDRRRPPALGGRAAHDGDRIAVGWHERRGDEATRPATRVIDARGHARRARLHRFAHPLSARRAGPVVGATARRGHARRVHAADRRVRAIRGRRERGSETATGITSSGAASYRAATGSTARRRDHPVWVNRLDGHMSLANTRGAACGGNHARHARRCRRNDRARRARRTDRNSQGQCAGARVRSSRRRRATRNSTTRSSAAMRFVASHGVTSVHHMGTWDDLAVFERAWRADRSTRASTRRCRSIRGSVFAIALRRRGAATPGFASARSRDSSTGRSARTPRRCSNRSTTRRTIAGCS